MARLALLAFAAVSGVFALCPAPGPHPDAPKPPSIPTTLEKGTWIIPMDRAQNVFGGEFNLHTYGYIVNLLWGKLTAQWVIRSCKKENEADFTAKVRQALPFYKTQSETREFRYGAIVIDGDIAADSLDIYKQFAKTKNAPVIFVLEEPVDVEVRHRFQVKPKAAIVGIENPHIHANIYSAAGLTAGVHYQELGTQAELILNEKSCFTLVSNPHDKMKVNPERVASVHKFIKGGGNFFAQCHAAVSYSAEAQAHGVRFIFDVADAGKRCGGDNDCLSKRCDEGTCSQIMRGEDVRIGKVLHPDLAVMQWDQELGFDYSQGGSWKAGDVAFANSHGNYQRDRAYLELSDGVSFKHSGGVVRDYNKPHGGMIFQLAGHAYDNGEKSLNGARMLLNAALVPSADRPVECGLTIKTRSPTKMRTQQPTKNPTLAPTPCLGSCVQSDSAAPTAPTPRAPTPRPTLDVPPVVDPDDATPLFKCPDGSAPDACDWWAACGSPDKDQTSITAGYLTCFPNYCHGCQPVWTKVASAPDKNKVTGPTDGKGGKGCDGKGGKGCPDPDECTGKGGKGGKAGKNCPGAEAMLDLDSANSARASLVAVFALVTAVVGAWYC